MRPIGSRRWSRCGLRTRSAAPIRSMWWPGRPTRWTRFAARRGTTRAGQAIGAPPRGQDPLIATGRFKQRTPPDLEGLHRQAAHGPQASHQTRTWSAYARRKVIVGPVFGQMHTRQNADRELLRGLDGARGEHGLHMCQHPQELHRRRGHRDHTRERPGISSHSSLTTGSGGQRLVTSSREDYTDPGTRRSPFPSSKQWSPAYSAEDGRAPLSEFDSSGL